MSQPTINASVSESRISVASGYTSIQAASGSGATIHASIQPVNVAAGIESASIAATVQSAAGVSASVFGGVGPQGPAGVPGPAGGITALSQASDVQFSNVSEGDVLRFSEARWKNYNERQLTDGGNF